MQTNNFLIKKSDFLIYQKRFSDKFIYNKLGKNINFPILKTSRTPFFIASSNNLNIKTSLYVLSKLFKEYKRSSINTTNNFSLVNLDKFSLKLQTSGFYTSVIEKKKKKKLEENREKILNFYTCCLLKHYNRSIISITSKKLNKKYSVKEGYKNFYNNLKASRFNLISKTVNSSPPNSSISVLRKKYTKILESRLFLYLKTHKKKYKSVVKDLILNKLKLKQLFNLFSKTKQKFVTEKFFFYYRYKKLVRKRKKKRNLKKTGFFYFLRRRRRFLYNYYIPRHLEVNYKTFDITQLGRFDLSTTNSRITFWLNLRRLLTFLSL
uniref:Uncharacterized protein n=1 Tax=Nannochloropsis oculata TaxID=43925 RepID=A0A023PKE7_9STRA|nr:hypothetical protein NaocMp0016 [Nannochloropsis oculata]